MFPSILQKNILKKKRHTFSQLKIGRTQNMISNDVAILEEAIQLLPNFLFVPMNVTLLLLTMSLLTGWRSMFGAVVIIAPLTLTSFAAKFFSKLQLKQALLTDKRLSIVHEIISGIRAVKAFAYEDNYMDAVDDVRRKETDVIYAKSIFSIVNSTFFATFDVISSSVAILVTIYSGIKLGASSIFTLTTLLSSINEETLFYMDYGFKIVQEAFVTLRRIEQFLCDRSSNDTSSDGVSEIGITNTSSQLKQHEDRNKATNHNISGMLIDQCDNQSTQVPRHKDIFIRIYHLSASWNTDEANILNNITINTKQNEMTIITGHVGSGKSSLLMAIQREILLKSGTLAVKGNIVYVPQVPWIYSGTVRDNITFGKPYHENKYKRILDVCDLQQDIQRFPKGDQSMIGERGVMLSGGQRARVSLARAVYSDADIYLMDDPLSAVDVKVGQRIFEKCICEELSGQLRVVVTHQLQYLSNADRIIVMKNGGVEFQGTYQELAKTHNIHSDVVGNIKERAIKGSVVEFEPAHLNEQLNVNEQKEAIDLIESEEDRRTGHVGLHVYWSFFRAGWHPIALAVFALYFVIVGAFLFSPNLFQAKLAKMSYNEQRRPTTIGVYSGLVFAALLLCLIRSYLTYFFVIRSARNLHPKLTESVMKSPVLFFDTNPLGRIMNRFSSDIGILDNRLPRLFELALFSVVKSIGVLFVALYASTWFLVVVIPLAVIVTYYSNFLMKNFREISRLEAISRSPVFAHVSETERGLEVIRSLQMESDFTAKMLRFLDEYAKATFCRLSMANWFALRIDSMCSLLNIAVIIVGITGIVDDALIGTLLTIIFGLLNNMQYGVRIVCEVENSMTSAERVLAYSSLQPEPGYNIQTKPPVTWPDHGLVSLHNVSLQYVDNGVMVLENLNLEVQPKEKVGIVGRTGAGKSSLFAAILRMPEPHGQIMIDGVDLAHINIQLARRSMAVISQDPFLFTGTIKRNLDPFDGFTDDEIWTALTHVQLSSKIAPLHDQLDYAIGTSGAGFSAGERQLLCLARALLQKTRILLMDEATANVDYKTDQLIQQTIRDKFTDCTVLTIAHRLNTIMDYDRVVVMDKGHVVEQGKPADLACKEGGHLHELIKMTGM